MGVTLDFYVLRYFLALKSRQLLEASQFSHQSLFKNYCFIGFQSFLHFNFHIMNLGENIFYYFFKFLSVFCHFHSK